MGTENLVLLLSLNKETFAVDLSKAEKEIIANIIMVLHGGAIKIYGKKLAIEISEGSLNLSKE